MLHKPMTLDQQRVRDTRLPDLEAAVAAGARCAPSNTDSPGPGNEVYGDWFREDGEQIGPWIFRRVALLDFCKKSGCPVLTQCREIALRRDAVDGDGDMVRAGMTGDQLRSMRRSREHRQSLDEAIAADDAHDPDAERREINRLHTELREAVLTLHDPRTRRTSRTASRPTCAERAVTAAATLRALRTNRRARTGWSAAA